MVPRVLHILVCCESGMQHWVRYHALSLHREHNITSCSFLRWIRSSCSAIIISSYRAHTYTNKKPSHKNSTSHSPIHNYTGQVWVTCANVSVISYENHFFLYCVCVRLTGRKWLESKRSCRGNDWTSLPLSYMPATLPLHHIRTSWEP